MFRGGQQIGGGVNAAVHQETVEAGSAFSTDFVDRSDRASEGQGRGSGRYLFRLDVLTDVPDDSGDSALEMG